MRVEGLLTFPKEAWELDCNYLEPALPRGRLAYGKCIPLLPFIPLFSSLSILFYQKDHLLSLDHCVLHQQGKGRLSGRKSDECNSMCSLVSLSFSSQVCND